MDLSALAIFAAALLIAAGSPGPSIAALVARVLTRGPKSVLPFLAAMWIGEAVWLSLAVFGLAYIAQAFHWAFAILKYCGVAYLLYLAWRMWSAPAEVREGRLPGAGSSVRLFLSGMAVTLGNPKIMVFYLALLPSIVDLARVSLIGWLELTATMMVVLMAVDLAWVVLAARGGRHRYAVIYFFVMAAQAVIGPTALSSFPRKRESNKTVQHARWFNLHGSATTIQAFKRAESPYWIPAYAGMTMEW